MFETPAKQDTPTARKVGILLFLGILLFPIVFTWFLLRRGHSRIAMVLGFAWLAASVLIITNWGSHSDADTSARAPSPAPVVVVSNPPSTPSPTAPNKAAVPPAPPAKKALPIAEDTAAVAEIEGRLRANEKSLRRYYGTADQLTQSQKDLLQLVMLKVDYLDSGTSAEEKTLGKKASALGKSVEMQSRQIYASIIEEAFMKSGFDVKVSVLGANKDQMRVVYALMSQPLVYKFQNEIKLAEKAQSFGFRKLVYSNGFQSDLGETWTVDLKN